MALNLSTIRQSALAATVAGAALLASWSPVAAQTTGAGTTGAASSCSPNCTQADVNRAIQQIDKGIAADRARGAAAEVAKACGDFLLKGVADKKWTQPEILVEAGGKFTLDNVCVVARRHGYERRAALD